MVKKIYLACHILHFFFTCRTIIKIEVLRDVNTNQIIYSSRSFFLETLITLKEYKIKNESAYIVIETTDESSTIKKKIKNGYVT